MAKKKRSPLEVAVNDAYGRIFNCVAVPILDIGKIFAALSAAISAGTVPDTDPEILAMRERYIAEYEALNPRR